MESEITTDYPNYQRQTRTVSLKPGETLDLGTILVERRRRVTVLYRKAPAPPFTGHSRPQDVLAGSDFTAGDEEEPLVWCSDNATGRSAS